MKPVWRRGMEWWLRQDATNERQFGAGRLLAYLLLGTLVSTLAFFIRNLIALFGGGDQSMIPYLLMDAAIFLSIAGMFWFNRRGKTIQAAYLFVFLSALAVPFLFYPQYLDRVLLAFCLPIIAASFLVKPSCSIFVTLVSIFSYTGAFFLRPRSTGYNWVGLIGLALLALLAWLLAERSTRIFVESRNAAAALARREEQLRFITGNMADVVWVMDVEDQRLTYISPSVLGVLGFTPEEALVLSPTESIHPDDVFHVNERLPERVQDFMEGKPGAELRTNEMRQRHKDGRWIPLEVTSRLSRDENGRLVVIGASRDITRRKQAEEALRDSEETYRQLFEAESDALFLIDNEEGRLIQANQAAAVLYGYTQDDLLTLRNTDLSAEPEETQKATNENPPDPDQVIVIPLRWHKKKDGTVFPVEITARLFEYRGRPVHIAAIRDISERIAAEAANRQQQALMNYIIEHDPNAIAVFDKNLRYLAVSQRYLTDYRIADQDLIGKHYYEVFPEMPERWREMHLKVLNGEIVSSDDDSFVHKDGTIIYNRWEDRPWYDENGEIGGMITYTEVTTERKLAEMALRQSEERFRSYVENASDIIFTMTPEGIFTYVSPNFRDYMGYEDDEVIGKSFEMIVHPVSAGNGLNLFRQALDTDVPQEAPGYQVICKNGDIRWHYTKLRVVRGKNSEQVYLVGVARDITERKAAELALQESEERYRAVFDNHHTMMFLLDPESGKFIDANPAAWNFYGYTREQFKEMSVSDVNTLPAAEIRKLLDSVGQSKAKSFKVKHRKSDGSVVDVEVFSGPVHIQGKTVFFSMVHDISERAKAEQKIADHLAELKRWQAVMLGREERILELKHEVNEALQTAGQPARYAGPDEARSE